nr:cell surface protein [uncultured bacterium]
MVEAIHIGIGQQRRPAAVGFTFRIQVRIENAGNIPSVARNLIDGAHAGSQILPEGIKIGSVRKAPRHPNDGNLPGPNRLVVDRTGWGLYLRLPALAVI